MLDFSKYMLEKYGVDDSKFKYPFGMVDKIIDNGDGPIVGVTYDNDPEHIKKSKRQLNDVLRRNMGLQIVGFED